jgi:hypothetical protein
MSEVIVKTLFVYGLAIIVSLAVAVVIKVIVVALNLLERKPAAPAQPAQPAAVPPAAFAVEADHLAVIAAAVHAMSGAQRIVHIEATPHHSGWAAEGRLVHHASHAPPHHPKH